MSIERDIKRTLQALFRLSRCNPDKDFIEFDEIYNYLFINELQSDRTRIGTKKALLFLESRGFIKAIKTDQDGIVSCKLLLEGELAYKKMKKKGIDSIIGDNDYSINKITITHSNIAVDSEKVSQIVSVNEDASQLIEKIIETLKNDKSLLPEEKEDAFHDLESVKSQLKKKNVNRGFVLPILDHLGSFASISSLVIQLTKLL